MKRSSKSSMGLTAALVILATISACANQQLPPLPDSQPALPASRSDVLPPYHLVDTDPGPDGRPKHPAPSSMPAQWVWLSEDGVRAVRREQIEHEIFDQIEATKAAGALRLANERADAAGADLARDKAEQASWWGQNHTWVLLGVGLVLGAGLAAAMDRALR